MTSCKFQNPAFPGYLIIATLAVGNFIATAMAAMAKPLTSTIRYTDKPVKIKGKLILNETGDSRSEIFLVQAQQVK